MGLRPVGVIRPNAVMTARPPKQIAARSGSLTTELAHKAGPSFCFAFVETRDLVYADRHRQSPAAQITARTCDRHRSQRSLHGRAHVARQSLRQEAGRKSRTAAG